MAETEVQEKPVIEERPFDGAAYMKQANEREAALKAGKPLPDAPKVEAAPDAKVDAPKVEAKEGEPRQSRSERRQIRNLERQVSELRGQLTAFSSLGKQPEKPAATKEDPEPQRKDFATDADHHRALGRWDARQEALKVTKSASDNDQFRARIADFQSKALKDKQDIEWPKPWEEVEKEFADDSPEFVWDDPKHIFMSMRIIDSPQTSSVIYHLLSHPEDMQKLLDLSGDNIAQDRMISRLEGKTETLYSKRKAAQAAEEPKGESKDRTHRADSHKDGRNAADSDSRLPKPSSEVAARGGAPTPDEPKPGTAAWMARRNFQQYGR